MKLFIDTANIAEIKDNLHIIKGVTTNPSLVASVGAKSYVDLIRNMIEETKDYNFDISAEVVSSDYDSMLKEAEKLLSIDTPEQVVIKLPLTKDGIKLCSLLESRGIRTNITLCFSVQQALMAMNAGASFISVFVGRVDDIGYDGLDIVAQVQEVVNNYRTEDSKSEVIAASIRSINHINELATTGVDIATIPPKVLLSMYDHPLTKAGLQKFTDEWNNSGSSF